MRRWFCCLFAFLWTIKLFAEPPPRVVAFYAPKPEYPAEARAHNLEGRGMFVVRINPKTGHVKSVSVEKSTGSAILDKAAMDAFRQWKFTLGTPVVKIPMTFTASGVID